MTRRFVFLGAMLAAALASAPCLCSVAVEEEEVVFRLGATDARSVHVVGDFNGWNPTMDLMVATQGGFEIRLFLLPGTYRYRFLADGVSRPDPDNPCLDPDGNSCFILAQRGEALEIILAKGALAAEARSASSISPSARFDAVASEGSASLFAQARIAGTIDEKIESNLAIGSAEDFAEGKRTTGESFLLRCSASYRFERGSLTVFSRPAREITAGDPLRLIGSVGPYRYPVSLFSRGASFEGTLPLGIETWLLYASRLSGYRSGLEGVPSERDLDAWREYVDSDIFGMRLGAKIDGAAIRYLYRQDRRPRHGAWRSPELGEELYRGFEKEEVHGVWFSLSGYRGITAEGELLFGKNRISATSAGEYESFPFRDVALEAEREHGYRLCAKVRRDGEKTRSEIVCAQTTLEGGGSASGERSDGSRISLGGAMEIEGDPLAIGFGAKLDVYTARNTGSVFWLGRTNFWLDGDEIESGLVPFLSARDVFEVTISAAWRCEPAGELPWGKGIRLTVTQRGSGSSGESVLREIRLSNGIGVHPRIAALVDMRGVSYGYGPIKRDFVDAFLSVRGSVTKTLWCAVGTGVNPYGFDRWLYAYSDHGREDYLLDRGVFGALATQGEAAAMKALLDAEEALAEDWIVTFEAGFAF